MHHGAIGALRLVIGAVSERPIDATAAVAGFIGHAWDDRLAEELEAVCAGLVTQPLSDHQGDGTWRRAMAGVMARRAVSDAIDRAGRVS